MMAARKKALSTPHHVKVRPREEELLPVPPLVSVPVASEGSESHENALVIRGAREHNLQDLTCAIPRDCFVVVSGLSGSGKSTLAFDIVFSEGQRRYVECLSPYARQFLHVRSRPHVDHVEGVPPTVAVEQRTSQSGRKSTVATLSGVGDFLRLLWARLGVPRCPRCHLLTTEEDQGSVREALENHPRSAGARVLAPVIRGRRGHHRPTLERLAARGVREVRVDGTVYPIHQVPALRRYATHDIEAVVGTDDTISVAEGLELSGGTLMVLEADGTETVFSGSRACPKCGRSFGEPDPRLFSFNSRVGACSTCDGYGEITRIADSVLAQEKNTTVRRFVRWALPSKSYPREVKKAIIKELASEGIVKLARLGSLVPANRERLAMRLGGLLRQALADQLGDPTRRWIESVLHDTPCPRCRGTRLSDDALAYEIQGTTIAGILSLSVSEARALLASIHPQGQRAMVGRPILAELRARLDFLEAVGLGYLHLDRSGPTLAGGESQRIRLASLARSGMRGALFVLDEPTIGLHPRDNERLVRLLRSLVDAGNGVLVVEHDEDTIRAADLVIDMGPGGGKEGGRIVAALPPEHLAQDASSPTGRALRLAPPSRNGASAFKSSPHIILRGVRHHNLKDIDVELPTGALVVITGVSGSGKSTLVTDCLESAVRAALAGERSPRGRVSRIEGAGAVDRVIVVDHTPIGRTPRSTPATYVKVLDEIRRLFSLTPEARARGFSPARFSFNAGPGRCPLCEGQGQIKIEMTFLPDVYRPCEECDGKRYNAETLAVTYAALTIADVLELSIAEAEEIFRHHPRIHGKLETMVRTGLGYLHLGQPSNTLSGGEAQRVKLAAELGARVRGRTLYLLDEPTTGLHRLDVFKLIEVLQSLAARGDTVVVIEHQLDVMAAADHIIDLGPEGGEAGGRVVATGRPEEIARAWRKSYTGRYLRRHLARRDTAGGTTPAALQQGAFLE
ncbi:MAG: excinuclease ABC subunit UvrA [Planctomycetota bacterium]